MRTTTLLFAAVLQAASLLAQTPTLRPLHVSPAGIILDDLGKPVLLRGLSRSATGSPALVFWWVATCVPPEV